MLNQLAIGWAVLGAATLGLALYRKLLSMHEDPYVHISAGEQRYIPEQVRTFHKLETLDRVGISLTVFEAVAGVALAVWYVVATAIS